MEFFFTKSLVFNGFSQFGTKFLCSGSALGRTEPNFQVQVRRQKCQTWTEPDRGQSSRQAQAEERIKEKVRCKNVAYAAYVDIEVPQAIDSSKRRGSVTT